MNRVYTTLEGFDEGAQQITGAVRSGLLQTAIEIRDKAKSIYKSSGSNLKYGTSNYNNLARGIMLGRFDEQGYIYQIKVHAMGNKNDYDTYKTRFFVGGTVLRVQTKRLGKPIKPYSKGELKPNNAIDLASTSGESILKKNIQTKL